MTSEMLERSVGKHLASGDAGCIDMDDREIREYVEEIKRKLDKDDDPNRGKMFYPAKEGYPEFTVHMKAIDSNFNLERAEAIKNYIRWKWDDLLKLELLTKQMSKELRLKIQTDKGKDPWDKTWAYNDLVAAIKKHAIDPVDPAKLLRT